MKIPNRLTALAIGLASLWLGLQSCETADADLQPTLDDTQTTTTGDAVTETDALNVASLFSTERFGQKASTGSRGTDEVETIRNNDGEPIAYVVNNTGGGWVMVSATRTYHPILAYSDDASSSFNVNDIDNNGGLAMWLDEIDSDMESIAGNDSLTIAQIAVEWLPYTSQPQSVDPPGGSGGPGLPGGNSEAAVACRNRLKYLNDTYYKDGWTFQILSSVSQTTIPSYVYSNCTAYGSPKELTIVGLKSVTIKNQVGPLLTSKWGQENGYNALCPETYAGCVPVAIAQIMKYHKYPAKFDWSSMLDSKATYATQYLIKDIRNTLGMAPGVTGSNINAARSAFVNYGYEATIKAHDYSDVETEIKQYRRPVYMRGDNGYEGHAWVCDGVLYSKHYYEYYVEYINSSNDYSNYGETQLDSPGIGAGTSSTTYNMNWGWEGDADGWYIVAKPKTYDFSNSRQNIYLHPK